MALLRRVDPVTGLARPPRWGLRTMGFLVLAVVAAIMSMVTGGYTVGQVGSLILGLGGAAYCSVRGIYAALEAGLLPKRRRHRP